MRVVSGSSTPPEGAACIKGCSKDKIGLLESRLEMLMEWRVPALEEALRRHKCCLSSSGCEATGATGFLLRVGLTTPLPADGVRPTGIKVWAIGVSFWGSKSKGSRIQQSVARIGQDLSRAQRVGKHTKQG